MAIIDETALGNWPRRLLHVPTMTSYEWQTGNKYGYTNAPPYNVITYTWGRYQLKDDEKPDVNSIAIRGIPWEVPRIDPSHFTTQGFLGVIQSAVQSDAPWVLDPIEYVWLDIACIDQRGGEPTSAAEIGRQAVIFGNAKNCFAWLTSVPKEALLRTLYELGTFVKQGCDGNDTNINACIEVLLADPWFSSLWTLQEAFIRQDVIILAQEGLPVTELVVDGKRRPWMLTDVMDRCERLHQGMKGGVGLPISPESPVALLSKSGLHALFCNNALATFVAATHRQVSKPEDRIYGIQQVFGLRVGTSAVHAPHRVHFNRAELEAEFFDQLLRIYPVQSQLFVHDRVATLGSAWKLNNSARFPDYWDLDAHRYPSFPGNVNRRGPRIMYQPQCSLSTQIFKGSTWAHFDANICKFTELEAACRRFGSWVGSDPEAYHLYKGFLVIVLDAVEGLSSAPGHQPNHSLFARSSSEQQKLAEWLAREYRSEIYGNLVVLLLGFDDEQSWTGNLTLGLLLSFNEIRAYYRRIGLCWWYGDLVMRDIPPEHQSDYDFLTGHGGRWVKTQGYFG